MKHFTESGFIDNKVFEKLIGMITYRDVMNLGFNEQIINDNVFFDQYGFDYSIITLKLSKYKYIEWEKETRKAKIVKVDKDESILKAIPVRDLEHLKEIIEIFK